MTFAAMIGTSNAIDFLEPTSQLAYDPRELIRDSIELDSPPAEARHEPYWEKLRQLGTSPWLDSGAIDAIDPLWNREFSGLTTNNTLLSDEVQSSRHDDLIPRTESLLGRLDERQRIREIAFVLSARHALRLVQRFRRPVSVELHTDLANDVEATLSYARRCHEICPEYFVVKVPFTPAGVLATKALRAEKIPVNVTLGFSARQNYVATALANPSTIVDDGKIPRHQRWGNQIMHGEIAVDSLMTLAGLANFAKSQAEFDARIRQHSRT